MRRMAGLFVYFYAALHLLAYSWFDMGFEVVDIAKDIAKRPFILVGFAAFVLLTPLAATSFNRAIKTMGAKRWQLLHRAVYAVAGRWHIALLLDARGKKQFCRSGGLRHGSFCVAGLALGAPTASNLSGNYLVDEAGGAEGKYNGPVCPQPAVLNRQAPRAIRLTRICIALNICKL